MIVLTIKDHNSKIYSSKYSKKNFVVSYKQVRYQNSNGYIKKVTEKWRYINKGATGKLLAIYTILYKILTCNNMYLFINTKL